MKSSSQLYSEVEISSEVLGASAHRRVQMLIDKCFQAVKDAKNAIANSDIQKKQQAITNASEIVSYLRVCLNFQDKRAEALANQLDALYEMMQKNFLQATLYNDEKYLEQTQIMLQNIKEGWDGIAAEAK